MVNQSFIYAYPNSKVKHLNSSTSDHGPLLLIVQSQVDSLPRPFKFPHMWCKHHQFKELVQKSWEEDINEVELKKFGKKLQRLKGVLKKLYKETFKDFFSGC